LPTIDPGRLDFLLAPVTAWAEPRADILGLALVGSWARGMAGPQSDVDLLLLVSAPQWFRADELWPMDIRWNDAQVVGWHDVEYGKAWSRHVHLDRACEVEFTFCPPSWAAADPADPDSLDVVSRGCRVILDKARLFERLLAGPA
jgi:predicted nucleotidyltransferase